MSLADDYERQYQWRSWDRIFAAVPLRDGDVVLDLGCGIGDQAAELVARGARVVGVDMSDELLDRARSRGLQNAEFLEADLRALKDFEHQFDGIWCSYAAAYFPDLPSVLSSWTRHLQPGGWVAFTEVDDLFGHEPLSDTVVALLSAYAADAFATGRYDFHMGHKLALYLEQASLEVTENFVVADEELSFSGPAQVEVFDAWDSRLSRMRLLQDFCGPAFTSLREEFLACLKRPDHSSRAKVYCCIARK